METREEARLEPALRPTLGRATTVNPYPNTTQTPYSVLGKEEQRPDLGPSPAM